MATFVDAKNREWKLSLTVGKLKSIRESSGIDLGKLLKNPEIFAEAMFAEPEEIGRLLWACCSEEGAGIGESAFLEGIDGPTIERATEALLRAVVDFFPRSKIATILQGKIGAIFEGMDRAMAERLTSTSKANAGASRG